MVSTQPRKQRKALYNLPLHKRRAQMSTGLDKTLKTQYKKNSFPLVKGDSVKIVTGEHKGKTGKVTAVDLKRYIINIEGILTKKANGKEAFVPMRPANVIITEFNLKDEKRKKILERK
jgi:large subunit ribosomal protein L24